MAFRPTWDGTQPVRRLLRGRTLVKKRAVRTGLMLLPVLLLFGFAIYVAWSAWNTVGDVPIGGHGVVAMVLGVLVTLALTGLLVGLLLYSRRHGHDR